MARLPRFCLPGVPQHVIQRGNNRQPCFAATSDYRFYLECVRAASRRYGCTVHAYVLMTNHAHLLVTPSQKDTLSRFMQHIGRRYVQYFNFCYRRAGTLWEGRYKASLVETERYVLTCYRYIELNPVRAGMVADPSEYRWSSYRRNAFNEKDEVVVPHELYTALGTDPLSRCTAYRELLRTQLDGATLQTIRECLNQEVVLGNDRFREHIHNALARRAKPSRRGRPVKQSRSPGNFE
ncbi:MAG TPA: transposase [Gammaproteobacteria bacterium]|nr:transposase [Gammaproteobacteria bacterium]